MGKRPGRTEQAITDTAQPVRPSPGGTMNTKHLLRWAVVAIGALALFAVACSSDDEADTSDGTMAA